MISQVDITIKCPCGEKADLKIETNSEEESIVVTDISDSKIIASYNKKIELIQGYTEKQWQEIIDGKYLCEFGKSVIPIMTNYRVINSIPLDMKEGIYSDCHLCRPARIKGVMRPIFVEPVDKDSFCCFFKYKGSLLYFLDAIGWKNIENSKSANEATCYIETRRDKI